MVTKPDKSQENLQRDDTPREEQRSHGSEQNRSKKDGHVDQIGTGQNRTKQPHQGGNPPRP